MTGFVRPALLLCLLLFCLLPGCSRDQASSPSRQASSDSPPVARPPAELLQTQKAFSEVYAGVMPAVVNISSARARRGGEGMRVAAVDPASRAAAAGVRAGDVILAVNHVPAGDQTSFDRGAEKARQSGSVLLLVQRGDVELYLAFDAGGR